MKIKNKSIFIHKLFFLFGILFFFGCENVSADYSCPQGGNLVGNTCYQNCNVELHLSGELFQTKTCNNLGNGCGFDFHKGTGWVSLDKNCYMSAPCQASPGQTCKKMVNKGVIHIYKNISPSVSSYLASVTSVNGACGSSKNTCNSGTLSNAVNVYNGGTWKCNGSGGGSTASCSSCNFSLNNTQAQCYLNNNPDVAAVFPTISGAQSHWNNFGCRENRNYTCACVPTIWTPNPSTVCSGTTFNQTSNCGTTRFATGTMVGAWTPATSTVCSGQSFIQTNGCSAQPAIGTKSCTCSPNTWTPDPGTVCLGETFIQTSNCNTTRNAIGVNTLGLCCISDNSCQSDTCIGSSCSDTCGNSYSGTKNCQTLSPQDWKEVAP